MDESYRGLSRRDFLKLSGLGLLGLLLPGRPLSFFLDGELVSAPEPPLQGRVATASVWAYDVPSSKGKRLKLYWRDLIVDIDRTAVDEDTSAYNRIWYKLTDGTYLYSGSVQPVRTILNEEVAALSKEGALGEVSVPFTDAHKSPDAASQVAYRLYYETTHWVVESVPGPDGSAWFRLLDDKYQRYYYVPTQHVRIFSRSELEPISPSVPAREKRIEALLGAQLVLAYEGTRAVFAARAASGAMLGTGLYATPQGRFVTYHKRPSRHMAAGDIAASGFDLPGVPWVMYIQENGISLHGTYWHNDFGHPRSHGCINLSPSAAKWLYRWSMPFVPPDRQHKYDYFNATRVDVFE